MMSDEREYATLNAIPPNTCIVCYKNVDIFSIGMCEHPVCYECSTRMRVLCKQNECPICRQDLPKVVFTKEIKPYRHLKKGPLHDLRYNIYFENEEIQKRFNMLLTHSCKICGPNTVFETFSALKDHMRKHELYYCDLCVENLKIFSYERRCYTRPDLALHRRKGDVDDKSHKGHPLCKFCDQRYMDNDELYRHLRRDHLYCHFCDADGFHYYYNAYSDLREHFAKEHFLCEEGNCAQEQFTSVFRSDIDLKAHKANVHCRQMGRAASKQARTLELEFTLAPRGDSRSTRRNVSGRGYHNQEIVEHSVPEPQPNTDLASSKQQPQVDVQSTEQFPTLGNAAPIIPVLTQGKSRGNLTIRSTRRLGQSLISEEDFPALGSGPETPSCSGISNTVNLSVSQAQSNSGPNVSIHVNHKSNGTVTTRVSGNNICIRPARPEFPALSGTSEVGNVAPNVGQWTKVSAKIKPKTQTESKYRTPAPASVIATPPTIQSGADFPSLKSRSNKSSSISIVPQTNSASPNDLTKTKTKKKKNSKNVVNVESSARKPEVTVKNNANPNKSEDTQTKAITSKSTVEENGPSLVNCQNVSSTNNSNNVQRKRSELKINNLSSSNNNIIRSEDFPALGGTRNGPGISKPVSGFESSKARSPTPPKFTVKQLNDNKLTFTNSSGESYAIVPNNSQYHSYAYTPPADFQKRNKNLVSNINEVLRDEESINEFRYLSSLFRQGVCDPQEYYIRCRASMGISAFEQIFPELMLLLPDIEKQRELFEIYKREIGGKLRNLDECKTCRQIIRTSEIKDHMTCHDLEKHFPALGIASHSSNNRSRK